MIRRGAVLLSILSMIVFAFCASAYAEESMELTSAAESIGMKIYGAEPERK